MEPHWSPIREKCCWGGLVGPQTHRPYMGARGSRKSHQAFISSSNGVPLGGMGKITYAMLCHFWAIYLNKLISIIGLKAPGNDSGQFWSNHFSILLCEGQKHFHDFGIFGRVQTPQNQHYLSLETPRHLKQIKKIPWLILNTYYVCKYGNDDFSKKTKVLCTVFCLKV